MRKCIKSRKHTFKNIRSAYPPSYHRGINALCSSRKYPYSPHGRFFMLHPPPPGNFSLFSFISPKNLAFKIPRPLGISNDLPQGGYGFFLEPRNFAYVVSLVGGRVFFYPWAFDGLAILTLQICGFVSGPLHYYTCVHTPPC